jgi:hypothetical protein
MSAAISRGTLNAARTLVVVIAALIGTAKMSWIGS